VGTKTLEQKIALAQNKLNSLKKKKNSDDRRKRTHELILLGAECIKLAGSGNVAIGALLDLDETKKKILEVKGRRYLENKNKNASN